MVLANAAENDFVFGEALQTIPSKERRIDLGASPESRFRETDVDEIGRSLADHHLRWPHGTPDFAVFYRENSE